MNEYTIRIYTTADEIVEYHISARSMFSAENKALSRFNRAGFSGQITRLESSGKI